MSNGAVEDLTLETADSKHFVIHRIDQSGSSIGLTATYNGAVAGSGVQGEVKWLWNGTETRGFFQGTFENNGGYSEQDKEALRDVLEFGAAVLGGQARESEENDRKAEICNENGYKWDVASNICRR